MIWPHLCTHHGQRLTQCQGLLVSRFEFEFRLNQTVVLREGTARASPAGCSSQQAAVKFWVWPSPVIVIWLAPSGAAAECTGLAGDF